MLRRHASCSDGWSAETSLTRRRSPLRKTGTWGSRRGPGDNLADLPRCKPDYCLNLGITWPGLVAFEIKDRVPTLSFQVVRRFRRRSSGTSEPGGRYRSKRAAELDQAPWDWKRSVMVTLHALSPEAMATYSDRLSALFAEGERFKKSGVPTEGVAGNGRWQTEPCAKVPFGYTDGISMTTIRGGPNDIHARSSRAVRTVAVCFAGRGGELFRA